MLIKKQKYMNTLSTKVPRGVRNNNPLNIRRYDHNDWQGKITDSCATDMEFEQFRHAKYGFRAVFILFHRYIKQGYNTVESIISRWAPVSDRNHVSNYIHAVCKDTGMTPKTKIECYSWPYMSALVEAMFYVENGVHISQLDDRQYWYESMSKGYDLYLTNFVH